MNIKFKVKSDNGVDKINSILDAILIVEDCDIGLVYLPDKKVPCLIMCKYDNRDKCWREIAPNSYINLFNKKDKEKFRDIINE